MKNANTLIFYLITLWSCVTYANNTTAVDPVLEVVESYIKLMNALESDDATTNLLSLYSEKYTGNTTYVKLSGAIVKKNYTKDNIKIQLNDIIQDDNYALKVKMNKVLYSTQKETSGTASVLLDFESSIDDKIAEKGTILMNIVASQQNGDWKIMQNNMIRVSESKDIGDCVCHIFEKGSTKFVTELYYPAGVKYDRKFEAFRIRTNENNRTIKSNGQTFVWENKSKELLLNKEKLGVANTPKEVIQLLIEETNEETCAKLIFR